MADAGNFVVVHHFDDSLLKPADQPHPAVESRRLTKTLAALQVRASELNEAMMEEFDRREDSLMHSLMKARIWGAEAGLQQFNTGRLEAWQEICQEYLPTTEPQSED